MTRGAVRAATWIALLSLVGLLVVGPAGAGERTCGDAVFADWQEGGIDGVYPPECYREALDSLPEDVRVYSSAPEDLARARQTALTEQSRSLSARVKKDTAADPGARALTPAAAATSSAARAVPLPIILAVAFVLVLGVAGSSSLLAERRRLRRSPRSGP
jgi:hypothetical protein